MATLINNQNINLEYLSLKDRTDLKEVLKRENNLLSFEHKKLLSVSEIESKDIVVSKKNGSVNGYAIINYKINDNNDVDILIERLEQTDLNNKNLTKELFESAIFVAVEKAKLNNNKIVSSSIIVNGKTINFDITDSYIKRNLGSKFNKDAIKKKIEDDEKYKKEREKLENKLGVTSFRDDMKHQYHINEFKNEPKVVQDDFLNNTLKDQLVDLQAREYRLDPSSNRSLDQIYEQDYEKDRIKANLVSVKEVDKSKLNNEQIEMIATAKMSDNGNNTKVDLEHNIVLNEKNERINPNEKKEQTESMNETLENLSKLNLSVVEIRKIMEQKHQEWKKLDNKKQDEILILYGFDPNQKKYSKNNELELENKKTKQLILKNDKGQAAFISSIVISFIAGLFSGMFIAIAVMLVK